MRAEVNIKDDGIYSGFDIPGVGSAKGDSLNFKDSNWIFYEFDWTNQN